MIKIIEKDKLSLCNKIDEMYNYYVNLRKSIEDGDIIKAISIIFKLRGLNKRFLDHLILMIEEYEEI